MKFRYSLLNAFLQCPAAYYKQHVLGEAEPAKSSALEFGTSLHAGIKAILDGDDGISLFERYWNSLKSEDLIYYRHGWQELHDLAVNKFLPNFAARHAKKFTNFIQEETIEMPFLGEHTLQGTFDLAGDYEGSLVIADWKTSTQEYKRTKIDKNPQMYIYAELYRQKYGVLPKSIMYKVFIKAEGRIQTVEKSLTEERQVAMMKNVENIGKAILHLIETKALYHNEQGCYCREL